MIENLIAFASLGLGLAFFIAWMVSPSFRAWLERPKYGLQRKLEEYDEMRKRNTR